MARPQPAGQQVFFDGNTENYNTATIATMPNNPTRQVEIICMFRAVNGDGTDYRAVMNNAPTFDASITAILTWIQQFEAGVFVSLIDFIQFISIYKVLQCAGPMS